jgi:hypothetical protein
MDNVISQANQAVVENYFKIAARSPEMQEKIKEGKICLGAQGERVVVVNYGETRLSSLIQSIKNFFTGVKVGEKAEILVKSVFAHRAVAQLVAQKAREESTMGKIGGVAFTAYQYATVAKRAIFG